MPSPPAQAGAKLAFLVCHGSFNPVHNGHLAIMTAAQRILERDGYRVVASILAPTDRAHIMGKGAAAMVDEHRYETLRMACRETHGAQLQE